ncbi:MAG TPA: AAA family ATPase [Pirellulales bacterium]|nr:AAA family ATPase [Pirellulales bacterium]
MKIKELSVKNFTVFEEAKFEFSPGLNIFIGENATGKTHLLKLMYSTLKVLRDRADDDFPDPDGLERLQVHLSDKLARVFRPEKQRVGRLVRRGRGRNHAEVTIAYDTAEIAFKLTTLGRIELTTVTPPKPPSCLFIPSREMLSVFPGFIAAYEGRELEFSDTEYDLCMALSASSLRGPRAEMAAKLLAPLESAVRRKVVLKDGRFYLVASGEGSMEAHLVAEGLRKVATVLHLIGNGLIAKNSVLFWDEPEANLNPRLITIIGEVILQLAAAGVQIFIATHDFLLTDQLSLAAEYQTEEGKAARPRFFGLSRPKSTAAVEVESGNGLAAIGKNSILDEYAAQQDRERVLFYGDTAEKGTT